MGMSKTPLTISSEINMKANTHHGWFLLVEGDFDLRFWEHRVHTQWRLVHCGGKTNVLGAIRQHGLPSRCMALIDTDYDDLLGTMLLNHPRLVYTDGHDLEMTLLHLRDSAEPSVLRRLLNEWIDPAHIEMVDERLRIAATCFGCLRYLNARHQWDVDFSKTMQIPHQAYFNHRELIFDEQQLWIAFAKKANLDVSQIETAFQSEPALQTWRKGWDLIQAHDFLQLLAMAIRKFRRSDVSSAQMDEKYLQSQIRLSVRPEELRHTRMVQTIASKAGDVHLLKLNKSD
jgi:hypothetical protein